MQHEDDRDQVQATSKGHVLSNVAQLDGHFAACKVEYEAILRSVGLQAGWRVLDAGCGVGSFLPLMSELVGSEGQIDALDLAPENVAIVEQRGDSDEFACPVEAATGSVLSLPYDDAQFDAIWCANTTQYLSDAELEQILSEFRRVLRPNGLLAIKEYLLLCTQYTPLDPLLLSRLWQVMLDAGFAYAHQALRTVALPGFLRRSGFEIVRANTSILERWQPLKPVEVAYEKKPLAFFASLAVDNEALSAEDRAAWKKLQAVDSPDHILNHPDFYRREGNLVVVATVPSDEA